MNERTKLLAGLFAFLLIARGPTLFNAMPGDWDEGNRMSIASSLNHGRMLYSDVFNHHTFLDTLFFQFLFKLLPLSAVPIALHWFNVGVIFAMLALLLCAMGRAGAGFAWQFAASLLTASLFSRQWTWGSHGEFYASLFSVIAGFLLFFAVPTRARDFTAGIMLAAGFYTKQTAVVDAFFLAALFFVLGPRLRNQGKAFQERLLLMLPAIFGAAVLSAVFIAYFSYQGALREAFYLAFIDPWYYRGGISARSPSGGFVALVSQVFSAIWSFELLFLPLPLVACLGFFSFGGFKKSSRASALALVSALWCLISAVSLGLLGRFYPHYLQQLIVPLAIASTFFVERLPNAFWRTVICLLIFFQHGFLAAYHLPLPYRDEAAKAAAAYVKERTNPDQTIYLYRNRHLSIYYLAERFPPTRVFMDYQLIDPSTRASKRFLGTDDFLADSVERLRARPPAYVIVGTMPHRIPGVDEFIAANYRVERHMGGQVIMRLASSTGGAVMMGD